MQSKKIISIVLITVMIMTLISCQSPAEDTSVQPSETVSEEASSEGSLVDGTYVINDNFDDNSVGEWGTYANGAKFEAYAQDGQLVVDITDSGKLNYAVQVFRDGFQLNNGCIYEVSFDIYSDIDRLYEWRFQINGGDYHAYYVETEAPITTEKQTVTAEFTMLEASDPAPRLCFNLGVQGDLDAATAHKVYIDNFVLRIKDASNAAEIEPLPTPIAVKVNQIGYAPNDTKVMVCPYDRDRTEFQILDASSDEVVYTGTLSEKFSISKSGDGLCLSGDFTDFTTPGTYVISVDGEGESYEFTIADDIYDDVYKDVVRMLYLQRCGCELSEDLAGDFAHAACHVQETTIYGTDTVIDVTGGWHDAGDYGRYVVPGAKTVMDLFMTYLDSDVAKSDDLNIPESGNGIPDLLDEAKYELDWMLKMQADNGGVYHKVTCANFPETVEATAETEPLIVSPISATATGDFAAVMAKASIIYKDYDKEFAATCLSASKEAYQYLIDNEDSLTGFTNPEDIVTGAYDDRTITDEFFWAAMELYLATKDSTYLIKAQSLHEEKQANGFGWAAVGYYGMYSYLTADTALQTDADLTKSFKDIILTQCDENIRTANKDSYFVAFGEGSYPWGSNMTVANDGMLYYLAYELTGDDAYLQQAKLQLDYLLGVNPLGYCYVTGYGSFSPNHTHHRPSQALGKTMPGMLVGGPNSNADDPYARAVLSGLRGGMCYVDNDSCYSTNEITIYWNSPLIYLLAQEKES